jgi:hypothetical protein
MQIVVGYLLIAFGLGGVILAALRWLGLLKPSVVTLERATPWDLLRELARKLPLVEIGGLLLIYAGLKLIGVALWF